MSDLSEKSAVPKDESENMKERAERVEQIEEVEIEELAIDGICGVY